MLYLLLVKALADFDAVIRCSKCKEALIRGRLNTILTCSLAAELAPSDNVMSPATPYFAEPLKLAFEKHREKKVMLDGKPRLLKGVCDYSLWYDSPDQLGTSLVVYEAKCEGYASNGVTQLLAYMGMFKNHNREVEMILAQPSFIQCETRPERPTLPSSECPLIPPILSSSRSIMILAYVVHSSIG